MSTFSLPSSQRHHFKDRAFRRSVIVSFGIHAFILVVAGSMTLFHMSGTTYAPSYSVDLISLPAPKPVPPKKKAAPVKQALAPVKTPPKTTVEKKIVPKPAVKPQPNEIQEKLKPSGGDEAARTERRQKIEELEMEARRLYESFTTEEEAAAAEDSAQPVEEAVSGPPVTNAPSGAKDTPANIRFRVYYDRIWAKIRSSWVVPEGVTAQVTLVTVVGIKIASDGEIEQFWVEERSGNEYYDQSALRAIRKANPLPPLPDDIEEGSLEVGINFRYPE